MPGKAKKRPEIRKPAEYDTAVCSFAASRGEYELIREQARSAGLSISNYLRKRLGLPELSRGAKAGNQYGRRVDGKTYREWKKEGDELVDRLTFD